MFLMTTGIISTVLSSLMILVAYWWLQAHIPTLIVYQALKFLTIIDVLDKG